jgi:tetratricopeptide (TPR) repeat protein
MRVSIQEGNTARAQEILQILQSNSGGNEGEAGARTTLSALIGLIRAQVQEARKGKNAEVAAKTIEGMSKFLDDIVKSQKTPTSDLLRMFGDAYAALEKHEKAVEFYRQVPEPAPSEGANEEEKKKLLGNYHASRILIVRSLRLDGKLDEAEGTLKQIRDQPWGKEHIEAQKEVIHLIAARGYPAKAFVEWKKMVDQFANKFTAPGAKDQYYECYYYMVEARMKYALAQKDAKKRDDELQRAARFITEREKSPEGLGSDESKARFQDLLDREPALKAQYDKLKAQ